MLLSSDTSGGCKCLTLREFELSATEPLTLLNWTIDLPAVATVNTAPASNSTWDIIRPWCTCESVTEGRPGHRVKKLDFFACTLAEKTQHAGLLCQAIRILKSCEVCSRSLLCQWAEKVHVFAEVSSTPVGNKHANAIL